MTPDPSLPPTSRPGARSDGPRSGTPWSGGWRSDGPAPGTARPHAPGITDLAPDVERAWADAFVLELRLADVPGRRIGDALVEVGSHCAESGESAADAFGDPVEYARSLELPRDPAVEAGSSVSPVPWVLQGLGLMLAGAAASAVRSGEPLDVTTGHAVAMGVLTLSMLAVTRWGSAVLGLAVRRPVVMWLALMAHLGLLVAVLLLLRDVVARVPGAGALAVGTVALAGGTVWAVAAVRGADDPIDATLDPAPGRPSRGATVLRYGPALMMPVAAVVLVGAPLLGVG